MTRPTDPDRTGLALGGFMATGKSTVGKLLALRLGLPFVDLDALVEQREGCTIAELFRTRGEVGFRAAERGGMEAALERAPVVLSLGGGTLHQPGVIARVRDVMPVVVLDASWPVIAARLDGERAHRPLANHPGVRSLYDYRRPGYAQAGPVVSVDERTPDEVATRVLEVLGC